VLATLVVVIVLLSGAAALLFETLWFRVAGLMLGNSVWASSVVLAAFMAGLAAGNGMAGRLAGRLRRPLRAYAGLELAIAALGLALVCAASALSPRVAALLAPLADHRLALNAIRLSVAFALLLVPSAAMGATLPTLVRATSRGSGDFGPILGRLYGWNTLGAVIGALAGELALIARFGIRGTALAAALLDLAAAGLALAVSRRLAQEAPPASPPPATDRPGAGARRLLLAAFLSGAALLALEVVWFRFLALFVFPTGLSFAVMLAVVLAGISAGGLVASFWLRRDPDAPGFLPHVALGAGILCVASYAAFRGWNARYLGHGPDVLALALRLMFPTCFTSGVLFVLQGAALERRLGEAARSAGVLTLANTLGAMSGSLLAGLLLLPGLGVDTSLRALTTLYGVVAACCWEPNLGRLRRPSGPLAPALAFALALAAFPTGFADRCIRAMATRYMGDGSRIVAVREGLIETAVYLRKDAWGGPLYHRLLTNGITMSSSQLVGRRYMKLFAWWPLALRPDAKSALLISYGIGSTARALTDAEGLEAIDVVDISPDILEMSSVVFPDAAENPLRDPRVRRHVEDGRFFLLTTERRFDLITAEPPPPQAAGVVSLYSREYFALVRARLKEGGIATHWLPVNQLTLADAQAVVRGFCDVFPDCTLWTGQGFDWMLAGTRDLAQGPGEAGFARLWGSPRAATELRAVGFERPEQLGATFLADAGGLAAFTGARPPLVDDYPQRLAGRYVETLDPAFASLLESAGARRRFEASAFVRRLWPEALRERTAAAFEGQAILNRTIMGGYASPDARFEDLRRVLTGTSLRTLPLLLMGTEDLELRHAHAALARGEKDPTLDYLLGLEAVADRDFERAASRFERAAAEGAPIAGVRFAQAFCRLLAGDPERAATLSASARATAPPEEGPLWAWLERSLPAR
jgi:predicted membrane-bound spermidine synthase